MRRLARLTIYSAIAVLVVVSLLAVALLATITTQSGTRWVIDTGVERARAIIDAQIEVSHLDGTLWDGLHFAAVTYSDLQHDVRGTNVRLSVDWSSLAAGEIVVDLLSAESVEYRDIKQPNAPDSSPPASKPFEFAYDPLPVTVGITRGQVDRFTLVGQGDNIEIRSFRLGGALIDADVLNVATVSATFENVALSISHVAATLSGDIPLKLNVDWSLTDASWSGRGHVSGSLAALRFEHSVAGDFPNAATGEVHLLHRIQPQIEALVTWGSWTVEDYVLHDGAVRIHGTADAYNASYDLDVQIPSGESARLSGTATGNSEQLTAFAANLAPPSGHAELVGSLMWSPTMAAQAQVTITQFDPSIIVESLTGSLDAYAVVNLDDSDNINITQTTVTGVLNDAAISARGELAVSPDHILCERCELEIGNNRVSVDGAYGNDAVTLSFGLDAPSLDVLWPDLAGSLTGHGQVLGSTALPQFTGELKAQALRFGQWSAAAATLSSQAPATGVLDVTATVTTLSDAGSDLGSFTVTGTGTQDALDVEVDWTMRDIELSAAGKVQRSPELVVGHISRATIIEPNTGRWSLGAPFELQIRGSDMQVDEHVWANADGHLRVSHFSSVPGELQLSAQLVELPLALANTLLPTNIQLQGTASADVDVMQRADIWSGSITWTQANSVINVIAADEPETSIQIPRVEAAVELRDGGASVSGSITIEPDITGELELALSGFTDDSPMRGDLSLYGSDWEWVPSLFPTIDDFEGAISATVTATGPLQAPTLAGSLNWHQGSLAVPALNVPFTNIEIAVSGEPGGRASLMGSATAGDGDLAITGQLNNLMGPDRTVEVTVKGQNAELINWPEYRAWASPDIVVKGSGDGWTIMGALEVPRADIALRELPEGAVTPSADVTVIGREQNAREPTTVSGETQIVLGDQVHISALGLDTRLRGSLMVKLAHDQPARATGEVTLVDGIFAAYGQKLTIKEGSLLFTGPLDNPLVDVRAVRVIDRIEGQVTAGIHLVGRAQSVSSTVYSEPAMSDANALSYLVIGRPLDQMTESQGGDLSSAARALGVKQATRITEQIGQALGFDQLTLAGDGGDTTALVAGKQLSSRLHARYSYGVFSRLGTLLLRYDLSQRLTLEAGAGEIQSLDILYFLEKQ